MKPDEIADACERLRRFGAAVTSDVLGEMGLRAQVVSSEIRPLGRQIVAGPAMCVRGERSDKTHKIAFHMDRRLTDGAVAVLATGDYQDSAVIGGNIALSFRLHGAHAVVTDGGIRDALEFEEAGLPVFCRFQTPLAPKGRWSYVAIDEPISLPGQTGIAVSVGPGDVLHGDGDGLVVVPREYLSSVVADAEEVERIEHRIKQALRDGADREQAYAENPRFGHIRKLSTPG